MTVTQLESLKSNLKSYLNNEKLKCGQETQLVPFGFQTACDLLFLMPVLWILDLFNQANMYKQITLNELIIQIWI